MDRFVLPSRIVKALRNENCEAPRRRLLIADDEPDTLELLTDLLADPRIAIDSAATGHEALEKARRSPPDVLLIDVHLPGMGGLEIVATLRRERGAGAPAVVFMSGGGSGGPGHAAKVGAHAWLEKPFDIVRLRQAVHRALEAPAAASEAPDTRRPLLIVDADPDLAEALRQLLTHPRVSIEVATDGPAALERARATEPHVVLLDITIPCTNGFEVFLELRRAHYAPRILLMSEKAKPTVFTAALALGAHACFRKPLDGEKLRVAVLGALKVETGAA